MHVKLNKDAQVNIFGRIIMKNEVSFDERVSYLRIEINCNFDALKI